MNVREQLLAIGQQVLCQNGFSDFSKHIERDWYFWRNFWSNEIRNIVFGYNGFKKGHGLEKAMVMELMRTPLDELWLKACLLNSKKNTGITNSRCYVVDLKPLYQIKNVMMNVGLFWAQQNMILATELLYSWTNDYHVGKTEVSYEETDGLFSIKYRLGKSRSAKAIDGRLVTYSVLRLHIPSSRVHPEILRNLAARERSIHMEAPLRQSQA